MTQYLRLVGVTIVTMVEVVVGITNGSVGVTLVWILSSTTTPVSVVAWKVMLHGWSVSNLRGTSFVKVRVTPAKQSGLAEQITRGSDSASLHETMILPTSGVAEVFCM